MFYLIIIMNFWKYMHILNLMPATGFKKLGTGGKKRLEKLWNAHETPVCSVPQVNMLITGYGIMTGTRLRWTDAKWKSVLWSDLLPAQSSKASICDGMGVC